jgi:hypothetical protein
MFFMSFLFCFSDMFSKEAEDSAIEKLTGVSVSEVGLSDEIDELQYLEFQGSGKDPKSGDGGRDAVPNVLAPANTTHVRTVTAFAATSSTATALAPTMLTAPSVANGSSKDSEEMQNQISSKTNTSNPLKRKNPEELEVLNLYICFPVACYLRIFLPFFSFTL